MKLFKNRDQLGIEFSSSIRIAKMIEGRFELKEVTEISKELVAWFKAKNVVTTIDSNHLSIKVVSVPKELQEEEVKEMLKLQFEGDNSIIQYELVDDFEKRYAIVFAVDREIIQEEFNQIKSVRLNPIAIETEFHASLRLLNYKYPEFKEVFLLVDIGDNKTNLVIGQGEKLFFVRKIDFSGKKVSKSLAVINKLSIEEAEEYKKSGVNKEELKVVSEELRSQLYSSIDYFQSEYKTKISNIFLIGGGSNLKGIEDYLENQLGIVVETLEENQFSVAKGLALRGINRD